MMQLPKSVRVSHVDVEIVEWSVPAANARHRWGEFCCQEQLIRIQVRNRQFYEVVCTLVHEINHVIYWAYELDDGDKEERICGALATGWAQVYRDNPEIIAFIGSGSFDMSLDDYFDQVRRIQSGHEKT